MLVLLEGKHQRSRCEELQGGIPDNRFGSIEKAVPVGQPGCLKGQRNILHGFRPASCCPAEADFRLDLSLQPDQLLLDQQLLLHPILPGVINNSGLRLVQGNKDAGNVVLQLVVIFLKRTGTARKQTYVTRAIPVARRQHIHLLQPHGSAKHQIAQLAAFGFGLQ
ncbi:hypothetical protein D3C75_991380 [compost metagenome]